MRFLAQLALCLIPVTQAQATEFRCYPHIRPIPARFSGHSIGLDGPGAEISFELTILPSCIMVTCATMTPGVQVLAFVRQGSDGPVLDVDPCGAPLFAPAAETMSILTTCLQHAGSQTFQPTQQPGLISDAWHPADA